MSESRTGAMTIGDGRDTDRAVDDAAGKAPVRGRWYAVWLLIAVATFGNIDRNIVGIVGDQISKEFALTNTQLGLLAGLTFAIPYTLGAIPLGMLVDRVSRKRLVSAVLAIWSAFTALSSLAGSLTTLVVARLMVGAAESGVHPATLSIIGDSFPKERRASVMGLFFLCAALGMFFSFALGGLIADHFGWRAAFLIVGLPGLLLSLIVLATLREPPRGYYDEPAQELAEAPSLKTVLKFVATSRIQIYTAIAAIATVAGTAGFTMFLSPFLLREHQVPLTEVGLISALILGGATALAAPGGGFIADAISKRLTGGGLIFVAIATALATPLLIFGIWSKALLWAAFALFLYKAFTNTFYGPAFAAFVGTAPARMRGALSGMLLASSNFIGYGSGPLLVGVASDAYAARGVEQPLAWAFTTVSAACCVISAVFYVLAAFEVRREARRTSS